MEEDRKHYKLGNTIQEFEEIFGNVPFEDIEKIKKYLLENYISKSKINDKIKELNEDIEYQKQYGNTAKREKLEEKKETYLDLLEDF